MFFLMQIIFIVLPSNTAAVQNFYWLWKAVNKVDIFICRVVCILCVACIPYYPLFWGGFQMTFEKPIPK